MSVRNFKHYSTLSDLRWLGMMNESGVQRIYITLRTDSPPPPRLPEEGLSQPLSACTDGSYTDGQVVQYTADSAERGWESASHH